MAPPSHEFGTSHLVEGSVRVDGGRVRVAVELVDAVTQQTRWSGSTTVSSPIFSRCRARWRCRSPSAGGHVVARSASASTNRARTIPRRMRSIFARRRCGEPPIESGTLKPSASSNRRSRSTRGWPRPRLWPIACSSGPTWRIASTRTNSARTGGGRHRFHARHSSLRARQRACGLLGRLEHSRLAFLRALELDPNHTGSMHDLSYMRDQWATRREPLLGPTRAWPLSARGPNDAHHVSSPLLLLRDDELSRWLAHAERLPDSRTQITVAMLEVCAATCGRAGPGSRQGAERAGNAEVRFTLNDLAVLAAADDAETLNEEMFRTAPEVPGFLLPESGRLRYAFLLQRRGDPRARGLIEESETRVRARIASGELAADVHGSRRRACARRRRHRRVCRASARLRRRLAGLWDRHHRSHAGRCARRSSVPCAGRSRQDRRGRAAGRARRRGLLDFAPLLGRPLE